MVVLAALAVAATLSSCGTNGLNFREDKRLEFSFPKDRAKVRLPLTVTWRTQAFDVTGRDGRDDPNAGYFGVFVDRSPQSPGQTQEWILRDDKRCSTIPGCPDPAYLAGLNIFSTTKDRFTIERLPLPSENAKRRREFHDVTVVLLNGKGERIGESAFTRQFEVNRGD